MNGPSRAQQFFDGIVSSPEPAQFLRRLVANKQAENGYLEFKGAERIQEKDVKEYWSKALSGFANTEGGVLIWGIRAEKAPSATDPSKRIDTATGLDFVPDPIGFAQTLKDVLLQAVIDPVQGVRIIPIQETLGGQGFVACLIPEGPHKPYRAELASQQYYQRIGDSFVVIPHSLLRSLFYPRVLPDLKLLVQEVGRTALPDPHHIPTRNIAVLYDVVLGNDGNGSGREVYVRVKSNRAFVPTDLDLTVARHAYGQNQQGFYIEGLVVTRTLHPGEKLKVCRLPFQLPGIPGSVLEAEVSVYATDYEPVAEHIRTTT